MKLGRNIRAYLGAGILLVGLVIFGIYHLRRGSHIETIRATSSREQKASPATKLRSLKPEVKPVESPIRVSVGAERNSRQDGEKEAKQQRLMLAVHYGIVEESFSPFVKAFGLPDEIAAELYSLIADARYSSYNTMKDVQARKIGDSGDELILRDATASDGQIKQLLGSDLYNKFSEYRETLPYTKLVASISDFAEQSGKALTLEETSRLLNQMLAGRTPGEIRYAPSIALFQLSGAALTDRNISIASGIVGPSRETLLVQFRKARMDEQASRVTVGKGP